MLLHDLAQLQCRPLGPDALMTPAQIQVHLAPLPRWGVVDGALRRRFAFADFQRTMAFVNAVAAVAHEQDHHPRLDVGYGDCTVSLSTHSAGGITLNDFICAARIEAMLDPAGR